jgi:hypothetical protein
MDALVNLILGVFAGVATSILIFVAKLVWDSKLHPLWREARYSGVDISGTWYGYDEFPDEGSSNEHFLTLDQSADSVSGIYQLVSKSEHNSFDLSFKVSGHIWEGYVTFTMKPVSRAVTSVAAGLVKISGGGGSLAGQIALRNVNNENVSTAGLFVMRGTKESLEPMIRRVLDMRMAQNPVEAADGGVEAEQSVIAASPSASPAA